MANLAKLAEKLKQKKMEATKIRRKNERALKNAVSLRRRSSSGLKRLERHLEHDKEQLTDINMEFNQILARKESLERLAKYAQDRLLKENEAKDQAEIELANADTEEAKTNSQYRLDVANDKIQELEEEIKIREKAVQKVENEIINYKKSQSSTTNKIHKEAKSKPIFVTQLKESQVDSEKLKKRLEVSEKRINNANLALARVTAKIGEMMAKKRKAAAKKSAAKRKAAMKKKHKKKVTKKLKRKTKKRNKSKKKSRR